MPSDDQTNSTPEPKGYLPTKVAEALRSHVPEELSKMMRERLEYADKVLKQNKALAGMVRNIEWREDIFHGQTDTSYGQNGETRNDSKPTAKTRSAS